MHKTEKYTLKLKDISKAIGYEKLYDFEKENLPQRKVEFYQYYNLLITYFFENKNIVINYIHVNTDNQLLFGYEIISYISGETLSIKYAYEPNIYKIKMDACLETLKFI